MTRKVHVNVITSLQSHGKQAGSHHRLHPNSQLGAGEQAEAERTWQAKLTTDLEIGNPSGCSMGQSYPQGSR